MIVFSNPKFSLSLSLSERFNPFSTVASRTIQNFFCHSDPKFSLSLSARYTKIFRSLQRHDTIRVVCVGFRKSGVDAFIFVIWLVFCIIKLTNRPTNLPLVSFQSFQGGDFLIFYYHICGSNLDIITFLSWLLRSILTTSTGFKDLMIHVSTDQSRRWVCHQNSVVVGLERLTKTPLSKQNA